MLSSCKFKHVDLIFKKLTSRSRSSRLAAEVTEFISPPSWLCWCCCCCCNWPAALLSALAPADPGGNPRSPAAAAIEVGGSPATPAAKLVGNMPGNPPAPPPCIPGGKPDPGCICCICWKKLKHINNINFLTNWQSSFDEDGLSLKLKLFIHKDRNNIRAVKSFTENRCYALLKNYKQFFVVFFLPGCSPSIVTSTDHGWPRTSHLSIERRRHSSPRSRMNHTKTQKQSLHGKRMFNYAISYETIILLAR